MRRRRLGGRWHTERSSSPPFRSALFTPTPRRCVLKPSHPLSLSPSPFPFLAYPSRHAGKRDKTRQHTKSSRQLAPCATLPHRVPSAPH
ncbi:unnamed protein product [Mesocestoides corti]|uniref:Uncharacterized protein n=1 Tax=Mesocestoides corti TaxID=53468 RepID=A0A0R3U2P3_MESCO|nr:unnamed protein product [Mesocestoides corti]